jgi:hypothetical protein
VLDSVAEELDALALPAGPARRRLEHPASVVLDETAARIRSDLEKVVRGQWARTAVVQLTSTRAIAIAGALYAAGAPHPTWRRWLAIAAACERLVGNWIEAVVFASIAGEWSFVDRIDDTRERFSAEWAAIWRILGKRPAVDFAAFSTEIGAPAWEALADAAASGNEARVERTLMAVVDAAMKEDSWSSGDRVRTGDPHGEDFLPFMWCSHASSSWAIAAILRRRGFRPSRRFGQTRLRYIEPGLAEGASWLGAERLLPSD